MEEMIYGPALWLWDYLRKSGLNGFFLPLSGGSDSSSTAIIVFSMCKILFDKFEIVKNDLRRIVQDKDFIPKSPQHILRENIFTCYMSTPNNSDLTKQYAKQLAEDIESNHKDIDIQNIIDSFIISFQKNLTSNLNLN